MTSVFLNKTYLINIRGQLDNKWHYHTHCCNDINEHGGYKCSLFSEVTESYNFFFFALKSLWISKNGGWEDSFKLQFSGGTRVRTSQNPCNQKSKLKQKN